MNKLFALCKRNFKEIIRDPLSFIFCLGFPLLMLVLMQTIFSFLEFVPENFKIENYATGICVFGYSFVMLFVAMLLTSDKTHEFINRLNMSPISKSTYLISYVLSLLPIVLVQTIIFFLFAMIFKLPLTFDLLIATIYLIPSALFYISCGLLIGTIASKETQAGPLCSVLISGIGILGGVFMPLDGMGGFTTFVNYLPFVHTVKIASGVFVQNYGCIHPHILWVLGYTLIIWTITILIYKFKKDAK